MKDLLLLFVVFLATSFSSFAADGDTTVVKVYEDEYINWYGNFYGSGVFDADKDYRKITLKMILGCPSGGCSVWDYSTSLYLQDSTGLFDSTLVDYPLFLVNGEEVDSVFVTADSTYITDLNNDSTLTGYEVVYFNNESTPQTATDTLHYFQGNIYTYTYNQAGEAIDSVWNAATDTLVLTTFSVYDVWEIIDNYEIGRVITPYGGNWSNPREHTYEYDITDYKMLLDGNISFKYFYGGWQSGWNFNVEIELIEGTPSRECLEIVELWEGEYKYGVTSDPIDEAIQAKTVGLENEVAGVRLRSMITGHSFGGNENCAEFCERTHEFVIDEGERFEQELMRDDCGFNPVYPQTGTWVYNRAGWCPGLEVEWYEYELTDLMDGDSMKVDYQFEPYSYFGGASYDPNYRIATYLFKYGEPNFTLDAELVDIISPSTKSAYGRLNPICGEPVILIKNNGTAELTSVTVNYGLVGGEEQSFEWTGSLEYLEEEEVTLDLLRDLIPSMDGDAVFYAELSNPNGSNDEYASNNRMESIMERTEQMNGDFKIVMRTNSQPSETSYTLYNTDGNVVTTSYDDMEPNTKYEDTVSVAVGCYTLVVEDTDGDGISWWANNDGMGYIRLETHGGQILKFLEQDFGSKLIYEFVVDGYNSVPVLEGYNLMDIYPNPSNSGLFQIDVKLATNTGAKVNVLSMEGQVIKTIDLPNSKDFSTQLHLTDLASGMYLVNLSNGSEVVTKKVVIQ